MKTLQEVFDIVSVHLVTQGVPSWGTSARGNGTCMYRGEGGLKCAIGVLLPDDTNVSLFEGRTVDLVWDLVKDVHSAPEVMPLLLGLIKAGVFDADVRQRLAEGNEAAGEMQDLLESLQSIHDKYSFGYEDVRERWFERLKQLAGETGLSIDKMHGAYEQVLKNA